MAYSKRSSASIAAARRPWTISLTSFATSSGGIDFTGLLLDIASLRWQLDLLTAID